jgi:translation initiation factor 2 beta subunit (eIF-2beta)/eIF-5
MKPNDCPWCDSPVVLSHDEAEDGSVTYHFVECEECGAQGPMIDIEEGEALTEQEAIKAWNTVAP